jgi:hypothetical protein
MRSRRRGWSTTRRLCADAGTHHPGLLQVGMLRALALGQPSLHLLSHQRVDHVIFVLPKVYIKSERSQLWWSPGSPSHAEGVPFPVASGCESYR